MSGAPIAVDDLGKDYPRGTSRPRRLPSGLRGRIPELDGLRGLAIAMVVIVHYVLNIASVRPGTALSYLVATGRLTWSGVDLFFVLSGFLIGGILLDARESSNYFSVFYTRRFFRIVPAYVAAIGACYAATLLAGSVSGENFKWMADGRLPWWPHLVFLQNFWMAATNLPGSVPMAVTWSLAVEEQFYLTLPLLIWLVPARRLAWVLLAGVLLAPALRIVLYYLWPGHPLATFTLMPCRADALLLGVLSALAIRDEKSRIWLERRHRVFLFVIPVFAAGMMLLTKYAPNPFSPFMTTIGYSWQAAFYTSILLYAVLWRESLLSRSLRWSWLGWLGTIAYGVYLFHQLILGLVFGAAAGKAPLITNWRDLALTICALALTLVFCRISWVYFEKPLVQLGHGNSYTAAIGANEA